MTSGSGGPLTTEVYRERSLPSRMPIFLLYRLVFLPLRVQHDSIRIGLSRTALGMETRSKQRLLEDFLPSETAGRQFRGINRVTHSRDRWAGFQFFCGHPVV